MLKSSVMYQPRAIEARLAEISARFPAVPLTGPREIDLVFDHDGELLPVEIKRAATPKSRWITPFQALDRLRPPRGEGGVICLAESSSRIADRATVIPFGLL